MFKKLAKKPLKKMNNEKQPKTSSFFWKIDNIKERFSKISYLDPTLLLTENRKDVDYRIQFLQNILEDKIEFSKTFYYHFISDLEKGIYREPISSSNEFIELFNDIVNNGIKEPLLATKINSKIFNSRYVLNDKKVWKTYQNETKHQLIQGAHRLAVALYLKLKIVPVKIFSPIAFEIPNYTDYIKLKELHYRKLVENG